MAFILLVTAYNALSISLFRYLIPLFLLGAPYILQGHVNLAIRGRDAIHGAIISFLVLMPFWLIMKSIGFLFILPGLMTVGFHLLAVSLPEEAFFRGYLQEHLGNTLRGVVIVSILFSVAHLPRYIFSGDAYSTLTFFPSLVMGYLYLRTSNILPAVIFHLFANLLFSGMHN